MGRCFMDKNLPLAFYGAGRQAPIEKQIIEVLGLKAVCFIDQDTSKQGKDYLGLPILSLDEAKVKYGAFGFNLCITLKEKRMEIFSYLIQQGIRKERIINDELFEEYMGCEYLEMYLTVNESKFNFCCIKNNQIPSVIGMESAEDLISAWINQRDYLIKSIKDGKENICTGCHYIKKDTYTKEKKIRMLSFAGNTPCQLSCIYCELSNYSLPLNKFNKKLVQTFDWRGLFRCLEQRELIANNAAVCISAGEFTLSPRKDEILDILEKYKIQLLTNAIIYDERIATLTARPDNSQLISIDAGTRETYKYVKGADAFDKVWANIKKYVDKGTNIILKYVLLPENCNEADITGFIQQASNAGVSTIYCSDDFRSTVPLDEQQVRMAGRMRDLSKSYGISSIFFDTYFKPGDVERILNYADN